MPEVHLVVGVAVLVLNTVVGLWGVGKDHRQKLPAKRGPSHFKLILDQLSSLEPRGGTTILESMHEAAEQIAQRALVVIASDFFVEPAALKHALQHLRFRRHDVVMFHVLDQVDGGLGYAPPGTRRTKPTAGGFATCLSWTAGGWSVSFRLAISSRRLLPSSNSLSNSSNTTSVVNTASLVSSD